MKTLKNQENWGWIWLSDFLLKIGVTQPPFLPSNQWLELRAAALLGRDQAFHFATEHSVALWSHATTSLVHGPCLATDHREPSTLFFLKIFYFYLFL
jgi:hypothetical protein